jgi:hypothetical protein
MKKQQRTNLTGKDLQAIGNIVGGLMDKQAAVLASKRDLENLATKDDLKDLERDLKAYMHQGFETVMEGMDSLADRFVEKERFEKLVEWAKIVGEKVGVKPKI